MYVNSDLVCASPRKRMPPSIPHSVTKYSGYGHTNGMRTTVANMMYAVSPNAKHMTDQKRKKRVSLSGAFHTVDN